ncbi:MAG: hypothetical protein OEM90_16880, partial [Desulfobacteraceae bacterium]|nr:hypothetical protein [Desulfobacteraceae bacterium]
GSGLSHRETDTLFIARLLLEQRQNGLYVNWVVDMQGIKASARNNYTFCLSFGPSTALHPPAHILICTGGCAL